MLGSGENVYSIMLTSRHLTDGYWNDWDSNNPPTEYIELAGKDKQTCERPDQWIVPDKYILSASVLSKYQSGRSSFK